MISRTTYEQPYMIHVYGVVYHKGEEFTKTHHTFLYFENAILVVAEVWAYEDNRVYTIIDDREGM